MSVTFNNIKNSIDSDKIQNSLEAFNFCANQNKSSNTPTENDKKTACSHHLDIISETQNELKELQQMLICPTLSRNEKISIENQIKILEETIEKLNLNNNLLLKMVSKKKNQDYLREKINIPEITDAFSILKETEKILNNYFKYESSKEFKNPYHKRTNKIQCLYYIQNTLQKCRDFLNESYKKLINEETQKNYNVLCKLDKKINNLIIDIHQSCEYLYDLKNPDYLIFTKNLNILKLKLSLLQVTTRNQIKQFLPEEINSSTDSKVIKDKSSNKKYTKKAIRRKERREQKRLTDKLLLITFK